MWEIHPSEWLQWFSALDWSHLDNVLSSIVGVTVLAGIAWAAIKFLWNPLFDPLFDWLTRRGRQAKLLDQLACGSSVVFVESLFGAPQFVSYADDREQRTYHLRGAWVMIEIDKARVIAFSVTITNRRMHYNTKRLTRGHIKVKLGKDTFGEPEPYCDGEQSWIGANRYGFARTYYLGRQAAYMRFIVSHNMSGVGSFGPKGSIHGANYNTGKFADPVGFVNVPVWEASQNEPVQRETRIGITANTLTVIHPEAPDAEFLRRQVHGPDESHLRLATAIKLPDDQTWRTRLRYRKYQLTQAVKKLGSRS